MELKPNPEQDLGAKRPFRWQIVSPVALALFLAACSSGLEAPTPELATAADSKSLTLSIRTSSDDAEETSSGKMIYGSGNETLDFSTNSQKIGLRFSGVTIPQGAKITKAYVKMMAAETDSGSTTLTIKAHDADSASSFPNRSRNISSRSTTSASVKWSPANWSKGKTDQTGDLSKVIQEVVSRSGWDSGNALALVITGDNKNDRQAVSNNAGGSKRAPTLYVSYTSSGSDDGDDDDGGSDDDYTTPSASQGSSCLNNSASLVKLRGSYNDTVSVSRRSKVKVDGNGASVRSSGLVFVATSNYGSFCLSGGTYSSKLSSGASWSSFHNTSAVYLAGNNNATVERVAVINAGDGFTIKDKVPNFVIRDSYGDRLRDDAFENDRFSDGTIKNNLIDNAFTAFSCRAEANRAAPRNVTVTMENNLVALRKQSNGSSHNDLFKWGFDTSKGCKLRLKNNVFLIENRNAGYIDPGDDPKVRYNPLDESACRGNKNIVVFTGNDSSYLAQLKKASPTCFTITTDKNVWYKARAKWFDAHSQFSKYE